MSYTKITKNQILPALKEGKTVALCANKFYPSTGGFSITAHIDFVRLKYHAQSYHNNLKATLEVLINQYSYYNCNSETGQKVSFYIIGDTL